MRKYTADQERAIRVKRLVDNWTRSDLLDAGQHARITTELLVDLRRTNRFLRLTLFGFGLLIAGAAVALVAVTLHVNDDRAGGALCLVAAAFFVALAETLSGRFRLYRFGVEEACAVSAVLFVAIGSALIAGRSTWPASADSQAFAALIAGSAAAAAVYRRFGYVYAAAGAMACVCLAAFQLPLSEVAQRVVAAAILSGCLVVARMKRRRYGDEFPGDEYGTIQASAWLLVYAVLNVQLDLQLLTRPIVSSVYFHWITYVMIWLLPAAGLWLSLRDRDRPLLDASLLMAIATLVTNKPYLGLSRKPWDPILLGLLLIGGAILMRRWLASGRDGSRRGITPGQLLGSDKDSLRVVGMASAAMHPALPHTHPDTSSHDPFKGDGGRSGGAGGGAAY